MASLSPEPGVSSTFRRVRDFFPLNELSKTRGRSSEAMSSNGHRFR